METSKHGGSYGKVLPILGGTFEELWRIPQTDWFLIIELKLLNQ